MPQGKPWSWSVSRQTSSYHFFEPAVPFWNWLIFMMVPLSSGDHFYKSLRNSWVYSGCIKHAYYLLTWPIIDYCCCSSICLHFSFMSCYICLEDLNSPVSLPCGVSIMVTFASPFVHNLNRAYFLLWMSQESCSGDSTLFDPSCMSNMSHTLFYRYISATLLAILHVQCVL